MNNLKLFGNLLIKKFNVKLQIIKKNALNFAMAKFNAFFNDLKFYYKQNPPCVKNIGDFM